MKRLCALLLAAMLLLSGCSSNYHTDVTPEEIVTAYRDVGYSVSMRYYEDKPEHGQIGYIQADHPEGGYIYFSIFETEEDAKAYKKEVYHPGMIGLFSMIFGDPSWQRWEVYGTVVVQYDNPDFYEPFEDLLKEK